jgi:hypothetical protein
MNLSKKNTQPGKIKFFTFLISLVFINVSFLHTKISSAGELEGKFIEIKILDKVSSKNTLLKLKIGEEKKFKNLLIKTLKCKNSEFDDNPEVTAYLQVKDLKKNDNDEVFVFNGWTFLSSPTINPFDHPVYNIWIIRCIV